MNSDIFGQLPGVLLPWYQANRRELPWRQDRDPYHIWVSEIMLQQTRVEAVKGYYSRFLAALPTVESLANVDDELLHKLWEGLGYYSRVRNLKKAAQIIMERYDGVFPGNMMRRWRCRVLASTPPVQFVPLPSTCLRLRWTAMCCGWFHD